MRISDWSSDVCSSDLNQAQDRAVADLDAFRRTRRAGRVHDVGQRIAIDACVGIGIGIGFNRIRTIVDHDAAQRALRQKVALCAIKQRYPHASVVQGEGEPLLGLRNRSEEHTSELQSLMRNSYAVFCLKKKKTTIP